MKELQSLKTLGTTCLVEHDHIPEDLNFQVQFH